MIKLIAMDLDNTVLDYASGKPYVGAAFMARFDRYVGAGMHAGIVTGRYLHEISAAFTGLGHAWCQPFPDCCIFRESYIALSDGGDVVPLRAYNDAMLREVSAALLPLCAHVDEWLRAFEAAGLPVRKWNAFGDFALEYGFHDAEDARRALPILADLLAANGFDATCASHRNATLVSAYCANAGKGNTVAAMARHFGIANAEVLAIGDSLNDLSMVDGSKGFLGACVGNADEEVKRAVRAGGGIVGVGNAWQGVLQITAQLEADGMLALGAVSPTGTP